MPTNVLRVNYRRTGGVAGITQLGAGMADGVTGSAGAGAGGLIHIPSIHSTGYSAGGFEVQSAYGLMSMYYGGGIYNSGYKIQPLVIQPLCFSTIANTNSVVMGVVSQRASGSLIVFQAYVSGVAVGSLSGVVYKLTAVVVSSP